MGSLGSELFGRVVVVGDGDGVGGGGTQRVVAWSMLIGTMQGCRIHSSSLIGGKRKSYGIQCWTWLFDVC